MPPVTRGRTPGPIRGGGGMRNPGFAHGYRGPGPGGRIGGGRVLLAEAGQPVSDTATDAQPAAPPAVIREPRAAMLDTVRLEAVQNPLFGASGPQPGDVVQGRLHNCPIGATLIALAHATPATVREMITEIPGDVQYRYEAGGQLETGTASMSYSVRLTTGAPERVTNMLYVGHAGIAYTHTVNHTGWVSFIEKGYAATLPHGYASLSHANTGANGAPETRDAFMALAGRCDMAYLAEGDLRFISHDLQDQPLTDTILQRMFRQARRRPTIAASRERIPSGVQVEPSHSYGVLGFAASQVRLRNPRGGTAAEIRLTRDQFRSAFIAMYQAAS